MTRLRRKADLLALAAVLVLAYLAFDMLRGPRPGRPPAPAPAADAAAARLRLHVEALAARIGERNTERPHALDLAAAYVERGFREAGLRPARHAYRLEGAGGLKSLKLWNVSAVVPGSGEAPPVFVVGAHYDSAPGTPGADDNASGVAALLELAARFRRAPGAVELRFVAFSTEEPPYFYTRDMGSSRYAASLKAEGREVVGMVSLEMLGCYADEKGTQKYPPPLSLFYPDRGNFIALVSDLRSRRLLKRFQRGFVPPRGTPVIAAALPRLIPAIAFSDHQPFWEQGFQALMVTDTAFLRYPHYHRSGDLPDRLDYARMADVVDGLELALRGIAGSPTGSLDAGGAKRR